MATNPYFKQGDRMEQLVYSDLVEEAIKMYGQDVRYLPRVLVSEDKILREEINSKFPSAVTIEMYLETVDGFEGDGRLFAKFGLEIRDQATFVVSKKRWGKEVGVWKEGLNPLRPSEGDLIYLPMTKSMFEVKFVEHESPFFQLSNVPVYKLKCEMFEYSDEVIDTGDTAIDSTQHDNAFTIPLQIVYSSAGKFSIGDRVSQVSLMGGTVNGTVSKITRDGPNTLIHVSKVSSTDGILKEFVDGIAVTCDSVSAVVQKVWDLEDDKDHVFENDPTAQNYDLAREGLKNIVFDPTDPFAENL